MEGPQKYILQVCLFLLRLPSPFYSFLLFLFSHFLRLLSFISRCPSLYLCPYSTSSPLLSNFPHPSISSSVLSIFFAFTLYFSFISYFISSSSSFFLRVLIRTVGWILESDPTCIMKSARSQTVNQPPTCVVESAAMYLIA